MNAYQFLTNSNHQEYFEATFGTPYRTAQVIFTLKEGQDRTFNRTADKKTSTWNEIFRYLIIILGNTF